MMYRLLNNLAPHYLMELCPESTSSRTSYNLRSSNNLSLPCARTERLKKSYIFSSIKLWNDLPEEVRCSTTLSRFKKNICKWSRNPERNYLYYIGDRLPAILHTRLRLGNSALNHDLFRKGCNNSPACACGAPKETVKHYFFYCNRYAAPRTKLLTSAAHLFGFKWLEASISVRLAWILKGIPNTDFQLNVTLFGFVHYYIIETNRFTS